MAKEIYLTHEVLRNYLINNSKRMRSSEDGFRQPTIVGNSLPGGDDFYFRFTPS
jgi:hypothetical protein